MGSRLPRAFLTTKTTKTAKGKFLRGLGGLRGLKSLIEIRRISKNDRKGLVALAEEVPLRRKIIVAHGAKRATMGESIEVYGTVDFLEELWNDALIK